MLMFSTIDGVAEFPDYPDDPAVPSNNSEQPMWSPRMETFDTLFLGRIAYEKWFGYWPKQRDDPAATPFMKSFSRFTDRVDKVVVSKTLKSADWPGSRIVRGDLAGEVTRLKALPGLDMVVGGGPRLGQSFLELDLVDELMVEVFPSVVGRGKPFYHIDSNPDNPEDVVPIGAPGRHDFKPVEARLLPDGTLHLWYRRNR